jgi:hypothetical protein
MANTHNPLLSPNLIGFPVIINQLPGQFHHFFIRDGFEFLSHNPGKIFPLGLGKSPPILFFKNKLFLFSRK